MDSAIPMVELWRGGLLESTHRGHAVICDETGAVVEAWGDASSVVFPRSAFKMIQALPLVESGAADAAGLTAAHLALACASHQGEAKHVGLAAAWLASMGKTEADLRCGSHEPYDRTERDRLIRAYDSPCQLHNNCSGKHTGFVALNHHLGGGSEYIDIDHPVQRAVKAAFEVTTAETSPGYGFDGCSAPSFATSMTGLARSMATFAAGSDSGDTRSRAMHRLTQAMATHPDLVAGEGRACTELMRAMGGRVAIKAGAEAVFVAIAPEKKLGIAIKIEDGNSRASDTVIAALLVRIGVLDASHPATKKFLAPPITNCRGFRTGELRLSAGFI